MEQLIESQYAKKIKENINLKSQNERLKQELKTQKEKLNDAKIQLHQSVSILIKQTKAKTENNLDKNTIYASYDNIINRIYLKIKKLKNFQGELKEKINESEILKKKIKKVKNIEIQQAKHELNSSNRNLKKISKSIEINREILTNDYTQLSKLRTVYKIKDNEIEQLKQNSTFCLNNMTLSTAVETKRDNIQNLPLKELLKQLDFYHLQKEKFAKHKKYLTLEKDKYINSIQIQKNEINSQLEKVNVLKENYEAQIKKTDIPNKIEIIQNLKNVLSQIIIYNNKIDKLNYDNEIKSKEYKSKEEIINIKLSEIKEKIRDIRSVIASNDKDGFDEKEVFIKLDTISKENQIIEMKNKMSNMIIEYEKQIMKLNSEIRSHNRKGRFNMSNKESVSSINNKPKTNSKNKKIKRDISAKF